MSFTDLYLNNGPRIIASESLGTPTASVYGIPFDSTHSYRPGCRFGPDAIREAFNNIEVFHPDLGVDLEDACIDDLGNMTHTVVASEMVDMAKKITGELAQRNRLVIVLGGEHSLTYGTYAGFPKGTGYVVFDAHYDLRDEYAGTRLSHAAYLRRIVEEQGPENILHVGARAFVREELEFLKEYNIRTISDSQVRTGQGRALLRDFASSFDDVYISIDLDVLDPAFAPGVGNPEADGMTSRELFELVYSLGDAHVTGADIVEMNPYFDNGSTSSIAAKLMSVLIAMNMEHR